MNLLSKDFSPKRILQPLKREFTSIPGLVVPASSLLAQGFSKESSLQAKETLLKVS